MDLPKQVQDQAAAVDAHYQAIEAREASQNPPADTPPPNVAPPAEVTPPTVPVETPRVDPPTPQPDVWEQRFKTLQGKYNAEVPRLNNALRELTAKLQTTQAQIEELAKRPAAKPAQEQLVTGKDAEKFGDELIDLIGRKADERFRAQEGVLKDEIDKLTKANAELQSKLAGVSDRQFESNQSVYFAELRRQHPDFDAVNSDPSFLSWLDGIDPMTGLARQAYLDKAFSDLDVGRTATIVAAWKSLQKPAPVTPAPAPAPEIKPEIQRQLAPDKSGSPAAPVTPSQNDKIWTSAEISRFYDSIVSGQTTLKPDEIARIEAEIDRAASEGRVR